MTLPQEDVNSKINDPEAERILKAQSDSVKYQKSMSSAIEDLIGALEVPYARYYQGQFENGVANGMATITFSQSPLCLNAKYEGKIMKGHLRGLGSMTMKDGTVKEGLWVDNSFEGDKKVQ